MVDFMGGYQPRTLIEVEVNGLKLKRPKPRNSQPLRCKCGFHDLVEFEVLTNSEIRFVLGNHPRYCVRCNKVEGGELSWSSTIPPKTKSKLEDAIRFLRSEGYGVYKLDDSENSKDDTFTYIPQDRVYDAYDVPPNGGKIKAFGLRYPVEENGPVRPNGIREVKDGLG